MFSLHRFFEISLYFLRKSTSNREFFCGAPGRTEIGWMLPVEKVLKLKQLALKETQQKKGTTK